MKIYKVYIKATRVVGVQAESEDEAKSIAEGQTNFGDTEHQESDTEEITEEWRINSLKRYNSIINP